VTLPIDAAPCFGQTAESIETWLRANVAPGVRIAIRHTQFNQLRYELVEVIGLGRGRFYTVGGSFYYTGKHCFHPKGQTRLVIPTPEVTAASEWKGLDPRGFRPFRLTVH
jgi:hypothetical protein